MDMANKDFYNPELGRERQRSAFTNNRPQNQFRLLNLPVELVDMVLEELPRFDYLNLLTSGGSKLHREYFQHRIAVALATEVGSSNLKGDDAFDELCLLVGGWNTTDDL